MRTEGDSPDLCVGPPGGRAAATTFFVLVLTLSIPYYLLGRTGWRLPGLPMLPLSALMGLVPMLAAMILVSRSGGWSASGRLVAQLFESLDRRACVWLGVAFITMPLVCLAEYLVLQRMGAALPGFSFTISEAVLLFAAFFLAACGEELGWQGYAYGALRSRYSTLGAALVIGLVWAAWHAIPLVQLGRTGSWILWHGLCTVALRVIIVCLYEAAGRCVLMAVVFHTMINLTWVAFPEQGSAYDPLVAALILAPLAAIVAAVWRKGAARTTLTSRSERQSDDGCLR